MKYYIAKNGQPEGPFFPEDLVKHGLTSESLVWNESMSDWTPAGNIPELAEYVNSQSTNIPPVQPRPPFVQPQNIGRTVCPKTWLVESILVTLFCCLPFGIIGIIKASNVESLYSRGDYNGADQASRDAGKWTKLGFFIGIAGAVLYMALFIIGVIGSIVPL